MPANDLELLRRYVEEGDEAAFTQLVGTYLPLVYHAARRQLGADAHLTEDVAQIVFSRLANKAPLLTTHQSLPGWLHTTTRFATREVKRREQRRRVREQEAHVMNELLSDNASEARADWEKLRPLIDDAIGELNPDDRETVLLRFFAGQPLAAIGAKLEVSENAARMRVERALEKLRVLLAKRGVTSTGAALGLAFGSQAAHPVPLGLAATIANTALAASTGSIAAAGIFGFMSTTKVSSVAAAVAVLLSIGGAVYEVRTSREAETQLTAKRRQVYALSLRVNDAERQVKKTQKNVAQQQGAVATTSVAESAAAKKQSLGYVDPYPPEWRARAEALMDAFPEIRPLLITDTRRRFSGHYLRLYEELGLSEAQIEAFEMIKIAGVSTTIDTSSMPAAGLSYTFEAMPRLPEAEQDARLRELLGERGFQRLRDFDKSQSGESPVVQMASALYATDTPLSAEQAAKLQRVLAEGYQANKDSSPAVYWTWVRAAAARFLSESQLAALNDLQASDTYNMAYNATLR